MKNMLKLLLILVVMLVCGGVPCWSASSPEYVQYSGTIVFYGSAPNSVPVFVTPYGSFEIAGRLKQQLSSGRYQQRTITLIGRVSTRLSKELPNTPVFVVENIIDDAP